MRRLFLCSVSSAFAIIGSIIGAGFITGKEVFEFFSKDLSLSGIYLAFICFSFAIYYFMNLSQDGVDKWVEVFVSLASIIVAGCMLSALDLLYMRMFCLSEKVKILSIITAILLLIISLKGIGCVERFCLATLPFVVIVLCVLCVKKIDDYKVVISPKTSLGIFKPLIYVGFNVVLSAGIIKNSGEKLSPPSKIIASLITSMIICTCIFLLSLAVCKEGFLSEMPLISLFNTNKKLLKIIDIITLFAIYSTLASSFYTINRFGGIKLKSVYKIALFFTVILVSEIGFAKIVENLYPALGILAYLFILVKCLLLTPFLKERQERTLLLPKSKGL